MKNIADIRNNLIKEYGNRCSICGKEFNVDNIPVIDHIIPCSRGGTDDLYNLQLTCRRCNIIKNNKFMPQETFQSYIQKIMQKSQKYQIIKEKNSQDNGIDLMIKEKDTYKICEIKMATTFTTSRINSMAEKLKKKEEIYLKRYSKITSLLIFPGEISEKNMKILKDNNIEVWDRMYLKEEFKEEIKAIDNPYFNGILCFFDKENEPSENEFAREIDKKIADLKSCEPGSENWSTYQKLIGEILELLFCPSLERTIGEKYDYLMANRRDFIMPNYAQDGFWAFIRENYAADFIVIDAKNSAIGVNKENILQIANYLKKHGTGLFGIIIARKYNEKKIEAILRDVWAIQNKMIVILNDNDIEQMLIQKKNYGEPELVIRQKIEDFRISI